MYKYIYIYIYTYVLLHTYYYIYILLHMYVCIYIYIYIYTYVYVYIWRALRAGQAPSWPAPLPPNCRQCTYNVLLPCGLALCIVQVRPAPPGESHPRHRLNGCLAQWVRSPPGEHTFRNCAMQTVPRTENCWRERG